MLQRMDRVLRVELEDRNFVLFPDMLGGLREGMKVQTADSDSERTMCYNVIASGCSTYF